MSKHGIDTLLADSFHRQVAGRQLPRNPYAGMYRQLSQSIFRKNLQQYFEEVHDRKMLTNSLGQSKSVVSAQLPLSNSLTVYGAAALLTNINRKFCEDLIKQYKDATCQENSRVKQVLTSFGGTELLRSQVLPFVDSSESPIELFHYIIIEDKGEAAAGIFAELVYNETLNCIRSAGSNSYFQHLIIEELFTGDSTVDYVWNRADILLYKAKLIKEITKALNQNGQVVVKCLELYQGSTVRINRRFTLVVINKGVPTNFEIYPLSSVYRGVFTHREDLELYINICRDSEEGTQSESDLIDLYMIGQSTRILKYLFIQDLRKAAWQIFYLCTASPAELFEQILDQTILNILTGDMSEVESIRLQLEICDEKLKAQLFKDRSEVQFTLEQILSRLKSVLEKGRNSDLLRFRELLAKLSLYCMECIKQNSWKQQLRQLLGYLANTLKFVVVNSDQLEVGLNQKQFSELVHELLETGSSSMTASSLIQYEQLMKQKHPPDVVNVQEESLRLRSELALRSEAEAADLVHILYFKEYNLFDNIYHFYLELFFGSKGGYPLAQLLTAIGEFTFETEYFGEQPRSLQDMLLHEAVQEISIGKDLVIDAVRFDGRELVGYHGCLRYAHVEEVRKLQELIQLVQLNRAELKIPGNCDLTELFSVSGEHLLSSSNYTERSIATLYLNIDVVVRGGTQKQADSLFYELVLQKCRNIDSQPNMGAVGFYNSKDREQSFKVYDPKLALTSEEFKQFAESSEELYLKSIVLVEDRIKVVNYRLNLHYVRADNDSTGSHLHSTSDFHQRHRLFFSSKDILLWSRVLPPKQVSLSSFYFYEDLDMNAAVKRYLITELDNMATGSRKKVEVIFQVLHFSSEKMHFLAREVLNFYYFLQYLKKDRRGRFEVKSAQSSLEMTTLKIIELLEQHTYCYNQGLSVAVIQHCHILTDYVQRHQQSNGEQKQLLSLERRTYLLFEMLEHCSQALHLEYRNILKRTNSALQLIV